MKKKINIFIENFIWLLTSFMVGSGIGFWVCKILGEDPNSWYKWNAKHKVLYWVISIIILIPVTLWCSAGHVKIEDDIEDFFDD